MGVALGAAVSALTAVIAVPSAANACEPTTMPYVRYDPTSAAADAVIAAGLWPDIVGIQHNSWITLQSPAGGTPLCKGETVLLRTSRQYWPMPEEDEPPQTP